MVKQNENGKRDPLTIDQTQKIIDQAISLHDKQIARLQKNSFLMPIITAVIASFTTGLVAYLTLKNNNESIKKIDTKVENIIGLLQKKSSKQDIINPTLKIETKLNVTKQKVSDSIENQKKTK